MKPITRKELYLNKIVGNNDYETPEKPITTEEFFFAEILGEAVQAPEPLTRYQMYLAKIAGREIEIPYPEVRLEYFLAKACGMDIETPTPITREEIFWSNYSAIVDFEVEGVPPLTYKVIEGTLENYRIYGNIVGGAGVGDLETTGEHEGEYKVPVTVEGKNLFDMKKFAETAYPQNATVNYSENSLIFTATRTDAYVNQVYSSTTIPVVLRSSCINVQPLTTYTISMNAPYKCFISWINDSFDPVTEYTTIPNNQTSYTFTTPSNCTKLFIRLGKEVTNIGDTFTISNIMLNSGSIPLPYEPYHAPVTTPIYLPESIKMVGDEAEYVDYAEQKMHRIGADDVDVTLPALPTLPGTNVLSVGTAVQPSKVYVKYKGERQ